MTTNECAHCGKAYIPTAWRQRFCGRECQLAELGRLSPATCFRLSPELRERLEVAAGERGVSMNSLANKAIADYLDRLIPADEIALTR